MKEKYIEILEYIRSKKRPKEEDIRTKFGQDGVWTLSIFRARCSEIRQKEGLPAMRSKRNEIIDLFESDILSNRIETLEDIHSKSKRSEWIFKLVIIGSSLIAALFILIIGSAALIVIPPIWLIILLLIYLAMKK